jgi:hypothetical protein
MDTNELMNSKRPCKRCGKPPTKEGYDACIGNVKGFVKSACCGHGVEEPYIVLDAPVENIEVTGEIEL